MNIYLPHKSVIHVFFRCVTNLHSSITRANWNGLNPFITFRISQCLRGTSSVHRERAHRQHRNTPTDSCPTIFLSRLAHSHSPATTVHPSDRSIIVRIYRAALKGIVPARRIPDDGSKKPPVCMWYNLFGRWCG